MDDVIQTLLVTADSFREEDMQCALIHHRVTIKMQCSGTLLQHYVHTYIATGCPTILSIRPIRFPRQKKDAVYIYVILVHVASF